MVAATFTSPMCSWSSARSLIRAADRAFRKRPDLNLRGDHAQRESALRTVRTQARIPSKCDQPHLRVFVLDGQSMNAAAFGC